MTEYSLTISPLAKADLANIYSYSVEQFGRKKASEYSAQIRDQFELLLTQPLCGLLRKDVLMDVRSVPVNQHVIFYRLVAEQIQVIRVLHTRQDRTNHFID